MVTLQEAFNASHNSVRIAYAEAVRNAPLVSDCAPERQSTMPEYARAMLALCQGIHTDNSRCDTASAGGPLYRAARLYYAMDYAKDYAGTMPKCDYEGKCH